jgi:UDP-N-acetyl-D-glucosamine dehydrogenase
VLLNWERMAQEMNPANPTSPTQQPIEAANATNNHSLCPQGEAFALPTPEDHKTEFQRLKAIVGDQRQMGRQIVVVMGVGFVGAVMAGVVADSVDRSTGKPNKFVIGMQRPQPAHTGKSLILTGDLHPLKPRILK